MAKLTGIFISLANGCSQFATEFAGIFSRTIAMKISGVITTRHILGGFFSEFFSPIFPHFAPCFWTVLFAFVPRFHLSFKGATHLLSVLFCALVSTPVFQVDSITSRTTFYSTANWLSAIFTIPLLGFSAFLGAGLTPYAVAARKLDATIKTKSFWGGNAFFVAFPTMFLSFTYLLATNGAVSPFDFPCTVPTKS